MVYLDTSVAVPLFVPEPASERAAVWFAGCSDTMVAGDWIVTEFASALSLKERRREITTLQAQAVWSEFEAFCGTGLRLTPLTRNAFAEAALMLRDAVPPAYAQAIPCTWRSRCRLVCPASSLRMRHWRRTHARTGFRPPSSERPGAPRHLGPDPRPFAGANRCAGLATATPRRPPWCAAGSAFEPETARAYRGLQGWFGTEKSPDKAEFRVNFEHFFDESRPGLGPTP